MTIKLKYTMHHDTHTPQAFHTDLSPRSSEHYPGPLCAEAQLSRKFSSPLWRASLFGIREVVFIVFDGLGDSWSQQRTAQSKSAT